MNTVFGNKIGRYVLLEKLGEGGMAAVYNAFDTRFERNVALKLILPSRQSSQVFLDRFLVEAKVLAQLSHSNIVKMLDYGEQDGAPYLVMEFIRGGTLKEALQQPLPYDQAAAILAPIARALDYVHKQKIIHRDVKPSNILLDENDTPMLSDFGVIRLLEESEDNDLATGVGIGTPDYMSPEQGMGKDVDFRADIYALGVVFYEMVTGQKPYSAESPMAVVIQHVTGSFPNPSKVAKNLPKIVEQVILRAVAKDPNSRYADMASFADALEELARGPHAQARRLQKLVKPPRIRKPATKKKTRPLAFILMAALILIGAVAGLFFQPQIYSVLQPHLPTQWLAEHGSTSTPVVSGQAAVPAEIATQTPTVPSVDTPTVEAVQEQATATKRARATATPQMFAAASESVALLGTPYPLPDREISLDEISLLALRGEGAGSVLAYSGDGKTLALGTSEGIWVYDASTLEQHFFIDSRDWVNTLILSPDGKTLTAGFHNGNVIIWDLTELRVIDLIPYQRVNSDRLRSDNVSEVSAVAYSSNRRFMAVGHKNGALALYMVVNEKTTHVATLEQPSTITALQFSPDNRHLLITNNTNNLHIWDINARELDHSIPLSRPVTLLAFLPDNEHILLGSPSDNVFLFSWSEERLLCGFSGLGATVTSLAASPDSDLLYFGLANGQVKIYALPNREQINNSQIPVHELTAHTDAVRALAVSPDGKAFASASWRHGLKTWDTETLQALKSLDRPIDKIVRMVFSRDSSLLVIQDTANKTHITKASTGEILRSYDAVIPDGEIFSNNGQRMVLAEPSASHWAARNLLIIDTYSGEVIKTLAGHRGDWTVSFLPNDRVLISGGMNEALLWDVATWEQLKFQGGTMVNCGEYSTPNKERIAVYWRGTFLFDYDQKTEALCTTNAGSAVGLGVVPGKTAAIYQLSTGELWFWSFREGDLNYARNYEKFRKPGEDIEHLLALSYDGNLMTVYRNGVLQVRSAMNVPSYNLNPNTALTLKDRVDFEYAAAFSRDGKVLALGSQFGTVVLYGHK